MDKKPEGEKWPEPVDEAPPLQVFFRLAEIWRLSADQQIVLLGSPARSTFFKWKKEGGSIGPDTRERISHLISLYKSLVILLPKAEAVERWIHQPNDFFEGASALDVMLEGGVADLYRVRAYADAQRGG